MASTEIKLQSRWLKTILVEGRQHWDNADFDSNVRLRFLRAMECRTPKLGSRLFASENEQAIFCNTCKSPACTSCGHWANIHWQRERWCALPESPYLGITLTMPNTLWALFAQNRDLACQLPTIAASAIKLYSKVFKGVDVGVMAIFHSFNGRLEFNSHVHTLVLVRDLQRFSKLRHKIFFDNSIMRIWQQLVIALLRAVIHAGSFISMLSDKELDELLRQEECRWWSVNVRFLGSKEHFLRYAGRYARRPPIAEHRIQEVSNGLVWFRYKDKALRQIVTVSCTIAEFIDRWAQHLPKRYCHAVRYCGILAPRRWNQIVDAIFSLNGQKRRLNPGRLRWNLSVQRLAGHDPLVDRKGCQMKFVRHLPPLAV